MLAMAPAPRFLFAVLTSQWSVAASKVSLTVNTVMFRGAEASRGDTTPLKNPKGPSFYIILRLSCMIVWGSWASCMRIRKVSNGCPMIRPSILAKVAETI